jgi:hypothetical protein
MNARVESSGFFAKMDLKRLAGPILVVMILAMMILPLPPFLLDLLFTFNIAVAMIVLLISLYLSKPLDFAVFPTVLLLTTLLRLALNVASTRVVLLEGHTGPDAAGKVIEAFGHFLVGGNYAVGIVVLRAALQKWLRVSLWTRCPVSKWRSTPTSIPGSSARTKRANGVRLSRWKRSFTGPWTVRVNSFAATPWPAS